jgi:hypothetical protein
MPAPALLFDEFAAMDALRAFVRRAVPEVPAVDVYRAGPSAVPGKWGLSVVMAPVNPLPLLTSPMGEESTVVQAQRVLATVATAAPGLWEMRVLGETAGYTAGALDDTAAVRDGLSAALALLGLPVTLADDPAPLPGQAGFTVLADVAGVSMTPAFVTVPAGGAASVTMLDDCLRRTSYNWGIWTIRVVVRDIAPAQGPVRSMVGTYCERLRLTMQAAASIPITPGSAYPYVRDAIEAAASPGSGARLAWRQTLGPFDAPGIVNGVQTRGAALDFVFDTSAGLSYDVPSLDYLGAAAGSPVFTG